MTRGRARRFWVAVLVAAVTLLSAPTGASAQDGNDFAIHPTGANPNDRPFFAYELQPGDVIEDVVTIVNRSDTPRTFRVYPADGYNTTDLGSFALRQEDEPRVSVGSWVTLGVDRWTLDPGTQVDITVRLEVPLDVTPGDHVGGIVALQLPIDSTETADGFGLQIERGLGTRIYVRVAGPLLPSLAIDQFSSSHDAPLSPFGSGTATTTFRITNTGNTRVNPEVAFTASGTFGDVETADLGRFSDLLPGNSVVVTHEWVGVPSGGKVTQSVTLTDGDLVYTRNLSFWVVPWWLVGAVVVLAAALLFRRWRRRRRKPVEIPPDTHRTSRTPVAAALLAVAMLVPQAIGTPAADAQESDGTPVAGGTVDIEPDGSVDVGDALTVSGNGWPARSNLLVEVCGNEARDGSTDCALEDARAVATSFDGRFATVVEVAAPPVACPCVLRVWTVTGTTTMTTVPLDLDGFVEPAETVDDDTVAGDADGDGAPPPAPDPAELRAEARITDSGTWPAWFAAPSTRTVVLTVHNDGGERSAPGIASLAWGTGAEPAGFLPLIPIPAIEAGDSSEHRIDIDIDAFTTGRVRVQGDVLTVGEPLTFSTSTTLTPWGLIVLVAAFALGLVAALARFLWRHRRTRTALSRTEMAAHGTGPALVLRGLTPDGEDPLDVALREEIASVFNQALDLYPAADLDDEAFVQLMLELSSIATERVEQRVAMSPAERSGLERHIADAVLESFGFVPVDA